MVIFGNFDRIRTFRKFDQSFLENLTKVEIFENLTKMEILENIKILRRFRTKSKVFGNSTKIEIFLKVD